MEENQLVVVGEEEASPAIDPYRSIKAFEEMQRMAKLVASSDFIPQQFKGNVANTVIALELSARMNASPMAVMQNLYVVRGKPSWSGKIVMALIRSCGLYRKVRYELEGEGKTRSCRVVAEYAVTGEVVRGPVVTMQMAEKEGWVSKGGSKWQTMPELMIRYRAASFFGNTECPEILCGLPTADEVIDSAEELPSNGEEKKVDIINSMVGSDTTEEIEVGWTPAAEQIIKTVDLLGTKGEADSYRMKHRVAIESLGDEADRVFSYIQNVYDALPE